MAAQLVSGVVPPAYRGGGSVPSFAPLPQSIGLQCQTSPSHAKRVCRQPHRLHAANMTSDELETEVDQAFRDAINEISNRSLKAMLQSDKAAAAALVEELQSHRQLLEEEDDLATGRFFKVLQGMLSHTLLKEASYLEGMHATAFNRICNQDAQAKRHCAGQVAGHDWKIVEEGKSAEGPQGPAEPKFSTWEDIANMRNKGAASTSSSGRETSTSGSGASNTGSLPPNGAASAGQSVADDQLYRVLDVSVVASQTGIKAAYRKKALQLHPDVSNAPDATERFAELSSAYDVLSDPESRAVYDRLGLEGMRGHQAASQGRGNASRAWDEFKPFKKENKRTQARAAAASSSGGDSAAPAEASEAQVGDVVEYPLREAECSPDRHRGLGLLVGRNKDRGDARTLPAERLDLCEVEPLRQEEAGSSRWLPDELGCSSFARLCELRTVPVDAFDRRFDVWDISAPLSDGCGGPELIEEIIV